MAEMFKVWLKKYTKTPMAQSMPRGWSRGETICFCLGYGNNDFFNLAPNYDGRDTIDEGREVRNIMRRTPYSVLRTPYAIRKHG